MKNQLKNSMFLVLALALVAGCDLGWAAQNIYSGWFSRRDMEQLVGLVQKYGERVDSDTEARRVVLLDGRVFSWFANIMDPQQLISERASILAAYYSPDGKKLGCRTPKMVVMSLENTRPVKAADALKQIQRAMKRRVPDFNNLPSFSARGFMAGARSGWLSHAAALDWSVPANLKVSFESGTRGATLWTRTLARSLLNALRRF